jgi:hypothetical protein
MGSAIAELTREGATPAEREAALEELNTLCEVIDNANDLHTLGGLVPALEALKVHTELSCILSMRHATQILSPSLSL